MLVFCAHARVPYIRVRDRVCVAKVFLFVFYSIFYQNRQKIAKNTTTDNQRVTKKMHF